MEKINEDINKIINTKNILYNDLLTQLENELTRQTNNQSNNQLNNQSGGNNLITGSVKILGNITVPNFSNEQKIKSRMKQLKFSKFESINDIYNYFENMAE